MECLTYEFARTRDSVASSIHPPPSNLAASVNMCKLRVVHAQLLSKQLSCPGRVRFAKPGLRGLGVIELFAVPAFGIDPVYRRAKIQDRVGDLWIERHGNQRQHLTH